MVVEDRGQDALVSALRGRGHEVRLTEPFAHGMGHAHALRVTDDGYEGATDPRCEGAVTGW